VTRRETVKRRAMLVATNVRKSGDHNPEKANPRREAPCFVAPSGADPAPITSEGAATGTDPAVARTTLPNTGGSRLPSRRNTHRSHAPNPLERRERHEPFVRRVHQPVSQKQNLGTWHATSPRRNAETLKCCGFREGAAFRKPLQFSENESPETLPEKSPHFLISFLLKIMENTEKRR
jgi:hypothetical protein